MNLKNYTSSVPADITIARIERLLVDAGATGIAKEYEGKRVKALVFQLPYDPQKLPLTIKLPANVEKCLEYLWKDHCRTRSLRSRKISEDFRAQAESTAWKLQQDWVEVQTSLIRLKQLDGIQAFLAYVYDGRATYYERIAKQNFTALLPETT
jgi:hypothetical protein